MLHMVLIGLIKVWGRAVCRCVIEQNGSFHFYVHSHIYFSAEREKTKQKHNIHVNFKKKLKTKNLSIDKSQVRLTKKNIYEIQNNTKAKTSS